MSDPDGAECKQADAAECRQEDGAECREEDGAECREEDGAECREEEPMPVAEMSQRIEMAESVDNDNEYTKVFYCQDFSFSN